MEISPSLAKTVNPVEVYERELVINELSPLKSSGLQLSKIVLWIIGGFISVIGAMVIIEYIKMPSNNDFNGILNRPINDTSFIRQKVELMNVLHAQVKDSQLFMKDLTQMVLLNLLLPILTALLGYIFGTRET